MTDRDDDILPADDVTPAPNAFDEGGDAGVADRQAAPARRGGPALILSVVALAAAGIALWQTHLATRGDDNAQAELLQRADALETRVIENERRGARYNELAATLREQLAESERLRQRLQEDLLALADRSARAEALIADLSRDRPDTRRPGEDVARQLLIQAEGRLRLFDDRDGAIAALDLAAQALAGEHRHAELRSAIIAARDRIQAIQRPGAQALLAQLDSLADRFAAATLEPRQRTAARVDDRGWWGRQFDRVDHLISIRREDEVASAAPASHDGARAALQRARLAALAQDLDTVPAHLRAARDALAACCEGADTQSLLSGLDQLLAIDWTTELPDLAPLRQRLDEHRPAIIDAPAGTPAAAPAASSEQESPT